jgi:hypothetical protein
MQILREVYPGADGVKKSTSIVIPIPQSREKDLHWSVFKHTADASPARRDQHDGFRFFRTFAANRLSMTAYASRVSPICVTRHY